MTKKTKALLCLVIGGSGLAVTAVAQMGDVSKLELKTTAVGAVTMIEAANGFSGGNIGVSVGDDGVFLIDDGLPGVGPKLKAKVATLTQKPIRFLLNTHWHGDHTGSNAFFSG